MSERQKPTPGPWEWDHYSLWGGETKPVHDGRHCSDVGHSSAECGPPVLGLCVLDMARDVVDGLCDGWPCSEADRRLIAAAGTAAHACEQLGYDGTRAIEALPGLLRALDEYHQSFCEGWCEVAGGFFNDCSGCNARKALAAAKPEE